MTSQTCNRIDLAREQLEMALVAFLERHRFASLVTLARAAERTGPGAAGRRQARGPGLEFDAADLARTKLRGRSLDRTTFNEANTEVSR